MAIVDKGNRDTKLYQMLKAGEEERDRHRPEWKRNRALLLGVKPEGVQDWTAVNLGWAAFETVMGVCWQRVPDGIVEQTNPADANAAFFATAKAQYDFEQMRLRYHVRPALLDVFWAGRGYIMERMSGDPVSETYEFTENGQETSIEYPALANQTYTFGRHHPLSVIPDPAHMRGDLSDASWLSLDYFVKVKELRESDYYNIPEKVLEKLPRMRYTSPLRSTYGYSGGQMYNPVDEDDDDDAYVLCREVWNRETMKVSYMPAYCDIKIKEKDWPVELRYNRENRFPLTAVYFNEHPDEGYPIPEMTMAAPQLEQFQLLFRTLVRDAVTKWRKFVIISDMVEKGTETALISGPGNAVIKVKAGSVGDRTRLNAANFVHQIVDGAKDQDVAAVMAVVKGLVHEIFGASDFTRGGYAGSRSATEAANLADFVKARMMNRTENIDSFFREVLITHILFLQETMDETSMIQVTDNAGAAQWLTINAEALKGNFKYKVIAGSSMPRNTEVAKQEFLQWYQLTLPAVQQSGGNIEPLIRRGAPYFHVSQQDCDQIFANHKQALMQLGLAFQAMHAGQRIAPDSILELIARVVNTGLSPADMKTLQAMAPAPSTPAAPGGMSGTNTSRQTLPS